MSDKFGGFCHGLQGGARHCAFTHGRDLRSKPWQRRIAALRCRAVARAATERAVETDDRAATRVALFAPAAVPERASDIIPATITIHRRADNRLQIITGNVKSDRADQQYKRATARLSHDALASPRSRQASVERNRAPGEIRESDMLGRLRGDEGLGLGLHAAGAVKKTLSATAAIEVRIIPSPKIGFN